MLLRFVSRRTVFVALMLLGIICSLWFEYGIASRVVSPRFVNTDPSHWNTQALNSVDDHRELEELVESLDTTQWNQQGHLFSNDGRALDLFGWSVAVSGNTSIVGGPFKDRQRGSAYVFARTANGWTQEQRLIPSDGQPGDFFGSAVAISGDVALIAADDRMENRTFHAGAVYVFVRQDGVWPDHETQKLTASDLQTNDQFGFSLSISGETIAIGTIRGIYPPLSGPARPGQAYVFVRENGSFIEKARLVAGDGGAGDYFGYSVATSNDTVIVGALRKDVGQEQEQGKVYIFERAGGTWGDASQVLIANDGVALDHFGFSVAIDGNTAVIGQVNDYNSPVTREAIYVFVRGAESWVQQAKLTSGSAAPHLLFGRIVSISGDTLIAGVHDAQIGSNLFQGEVDVFKRQGVVWSQFQRLIASDAQPYDQFGNAVAVSGPILVVGAYADDVSSPSGTRNHQGSAYVFQNPDSDGDALPDEWEQSGVTIDGVHIDLPAMGASPNHKDIFIHLDWMAPDPAHPSVTFTPNARAIKMVRDAFATAPVRNPDHQLGVNLHVDFGPGSVMNPVTGATWGSLSGAGEVPFSSLIDFNNADTLKTIRFDPLKRRAVFHYALYCNLIEKADGPFNGGISRDAPGADFLLAGGVHPANDPLLEAAVFMHELGHNLGLDHGGDDEVNYKPNYISVMNYRFDFIGTLRPNGRQRYIDYSRRSLATLDESHLDENAGISDPEGHLTTWSRFTRPDNPPHSNKCIENPDFFFRLFYPSAALDWDCDGVRDSGPLPGAFDVNGDGMCVGPKDASGLHTIPNNAAPPGRVGDDILFEEFLFGIRTAVITSGPNRSCDTRADPRDKQLSEPNDVEPRLLTGFEDWSHLIFDGGGPIGTINTASSNRLLRTTTESTELPLEDIIALIPPVLLEEQRTAPLDTVNYSPAAGPAPLTVTFDGSTSTASNGSIVSWTWDFGDGSSASGPTLVHTYTSAGEYFATLTVVDSNGHVNLVPLLNRVTVGAPVPTPTPTPTPTPSPTPSPTPTGGAGDVDSGFEATATQNLGEVFSIISQPDGKLLVGGSFESFGGGLHRGVSRVNPDGTPDPTFRPGLAFQVRGKGARVLALALQADGKILAGVAYPTSLTAPEPLLVRLDPDGTIDSTFQYTINSFDGEIDSIAVQPDGKIVVGGQFRYTGPNNTTAFHLARLNSDGSFDASFVLAGSPNGAIKSVLLQPDGKILVGGNFTDDSGVFPRRAIARVNSDGSLDTSFNANLGIPSFVRKLALQPDGKLVATGLLNLDGSNQHNEALARFNPNGTRDNSFLNLFSGNIIDLGLQTDGRLLVAGSFALSSPAMRNNIARVNSDGTLDFSFEMRDVGVNQYVTAVAVQTSAQYLGRVVIAGGFNNLNTGTAEHLFQLNSNGTRDISFSATEPGFNAQVNTLALQSDNKVLVGFSPIQSLSEILRVNQAQRQAIARLNADGSIDTSFDSPFLSGSTTNSVTYIATKPDGKIIVTGSFRFGSSGSISNITQLNQDGSVDPAFVPYCCAGIGPVAIQPDGKIIARGYIHSQGLVRLNSDGSLDQTFDLAVSGGVDALAIQSDSRILVAGDFNSVCHGGPCTFVNNVVRVMPDGTVDSTFATGAGPNQAVESLVIQPDGKIVIGGKFGTFDGTARPGIARINANGSLDSTFVPVNPNIGIDGMISVGSMVLQRDGKLVCGGTRSRSTNRGPNRLFRLLTNGSLDPSYNQSTGIEGTRDDVNAMILQPDGKIIIGGEFDVVNGFARLALARLNADPGSPTPSPTPTPTPSPTATPTPSPTPTPTPGTGAGTLEFSDPVYFIDEGLDEAIINVNRTNGANGAVTVDFATNVSTGYQPCHTPVNALPSQNCDFAFKDGTLSFASGETAKTFSVLISKDAYFEGNERIWLSLRNATGGATLGVQSNATLTILNNDSVAINSQPVDESLVFVGQHYHDFLARQADQGGLDYWVAQINGCGSNRACINRRRIDVSNAFFFESEYQRTGAYVFRLYRAAYGNHQPFPNPDGSTEANKVPAYSIFLRDRARVVDGPDLPQSQLALATLLVQRPEFLAKYPATLDAAGFVEAVLTTLRNDMAIDLGSQRNTLIDLFNQSGGGTAGRGNVLFRLADDREQANPIDNRSFIDAEYNRAFVFTEYAGYLRRDADIGGFMFWLDQVNRYPVRNTLIQHAMVCAFITSAEYQQRFGSSVTHTNAECGP